jgi:AcrR family transcriptional regulator
LNFPGGTTKECVVTKTLVAQHTYTAHRERQRRRILDAARASFDQKGIDRVTMAEIITAAGLMGSTVYQYFANKDEIVWALVREVLERFRAVLQDQVDPVQGTALIRITALLEVIGAQLSTAISDVRFMAEFDALYARNWSAEQLIELEEELFPMGMKQLRILVREGIDDGSLRADLDADTALHAVITTIIASQRRLAALGDRIEKEFGRPIEALMNESIRIILQGLRA